MTTPVQASTSSPLNGATSGTHAVTATTVGNTVVVAFFFDTATLNNYTGVTVTDNAAGGSNTWSTAILKIGGSQGYIICIADCLNPTKSFTSVTVTPTGSTGGVFGRYGFWELPGTYARDQGVSANQTAGPLVLTAPAPDVSAIDFVVCCYAMGNGANPTGITNPPTTGYTAVASSNNDNTDCGGIAAYRFNTTLQTNTATCTDTTPSATFDCGALQSYNPLAGIGFGVGTATEGHDTSSGSGTVTNRGAGTPTEGHDTSSGAGTVTNRGSGTPTEGHDTSSGTGTGVTGASGSGAPTEGADTASGAGSVAVSGSGAPAESADTSSGVGTVAVSGSGSPTESSDIASGTGSVLASGTGAPTEDSDTAAGTGTAAATGSGSPTESADTSSGAGIVAVSGSGSPTEGADTSTGVGVAAGAGSGTGDILEGHDTATGSGTIAVSGSGTPTEGSDTASGTGTSSGIASGSGSPTEGADIANGSGTVSTNGIGSPAEDSDSAVGIGTSGFPGSGSGSPTESPDTASGTGTGGGSPIPNLGPPPPPGDQFEGAFASAPPFYYEPPGGRPYPSVMAGEGGLQAGTFPGQSGIAVGRFGWANPRNGIVQNSRVTDPDQIGIVVPVRVNWERAYWSGGRRFIRSGFGVSVISRGAFWVQFLGGAFPGDPVYADLLTGGAISGVASGAELTRWVVVNYCQPGDLAIISTDTNFT